VVRIPHVRARLDIHIVTPARRGSRKGNRVTAERYAGLLQKLGHRVTIDTRERDCDLLFALHARKSAAAMRRFRRAHPGKPIVLVLTGTDIYGSRPLPSLALATRIIVLQPEGLKKIPPRFRARAVSIIQSAVVPRANPDRKHFTVCFLGHLRAVKDPFRAAYAMRDLPADSRIRLIQAGGAYTPAMAARARAEMRRNSRYRWLGNISQQRAHALLASSRLLVLTSRLEGGANVVCEALAAGVPVISSDIDGSRGLLGHDYPGYFHVGDTRALRALLLRAERDSEFYDRLRRACRARAKLVDPAHERAGLGKVVGPLRIRSN
jgi:putative glycosyltransferase (TIGR04348 family)